MLKLRGSFKGFGSGKCEVRYHIDDDKRVIHVLDLGLPNTTSLTQATDNVQNGILNSIGKSFETNREYTWILYTTDGRATTYEDGDFVEFIPLNV